VFTDIPDEESN